MLTTFVLFFIALHEVCLVTSWPTTMHSVSANPSIQVAVISTFFSIPLSTYYFLRSFAEKSDIEPIWWHTTVIVRRFLILCSLISVHVATFFLGVYVLSMFLKGKLTKNTTRVLDDARDFCLCSSQLMILFLSALDDKALWVVLFLNFYFFPLYPLKAKIIAQDLILFYLYCMLGPL